MSVFTGGSVNSLVAVPEHYQFHRYCSEAHSDSFSFAAVSGTTYRIAVAGYLAEMGTFAGRLYYGPQTGIDRGPYGRAQAPYRFSFVSSEEDSSFRCALDGAQPQACSSPQTYEGLVEGSTHTFSVVATDPAGHADPTPATSTFTVDNTPPETTITSGPSGTTSSADARFDFSSSESPSPFTEGAGFTCRLDGEVDINDGCDPPRDYFQLCDEPHTFRVVARDEALNVDPTPATRTWTIAGGGVTCAAPTVDLEYSTPASYSVGIGARINSHGAGTHYHIAYGTSTAYGSSTQEANSPPGGSDSGGYIDTSISELEPSTTYHYQVIATNPSGTTAGSDRTFVTGAGSPPPRPTTGSATSVTMTSATLNGAVEPRGLLTRYSFEYGRDTYYGSLTAESYADSSVASQAVSAPIAGLDPGTTYHYRLVARNNTTVHGADRTFTTPTTGGPGPSPGPRGGTPGPAPSPGPGPVSAPPPGKYARPAGPTATPEQIVAALRSALALTGTGAKITAILRSGGYVSVFSAPSGGSIQILWYFVPRGARLRTKARPRPLLVAKGTKRVAAGGKTTIRVKLTSQGRHLFTRAKRLKITAKGTFTTRAGTRVTNVRQLALHR